MAHGHFIDGVWYSQWHATSASGAFQFTESRFRNWVTVDGSPGPSGAGGFAAERGRYHLYVSLACPFAHRAVIFRALKRLDDVISMSVASWAMRGGSSATAPATRPTR